MKFFPQRETASSLRILLVGGVHGDEPFGQRVIERLLADEVRGPRVSLLLANEEALAAKKRGVQGDLNRSFPGNPTGTHEERLAAEIFPHVLQATHVIDLHTTTSDIVLTPIVPCLDMEIRRMLGYTTSREIACVQPPFGKQSLIGRIHHGMVLEFNESYATTEAAYEDVLRVIDGLLEQKPALGIERRMFHVTGVIPRSMLLPADAQNFRYSHALEAYPFLLSERGYAEAGYHCLKATSFSLVTI
jgi:hypothetical protein